MREMFQQFVNFAKEEGSTTCELLLLQHWVTFLGIPPLSGLQAATWHMCSSSSSPVLLQILDSNPGFTWLLKTKAALSRKAHSVCFNFRCQPGDVIK